MLKIKPDLFIHTKYYDMCDQHYPQLKHVFNLLSLSDYNASLNMKKTATIVFNDNKIKRIQPILEPYFKKCIGVGTKPKVTSYYFNEPMLMYSTNIRSPRYVIWTEYDSLPICATAVTRVSIYELEKAVQKALVWASTKTDYEPNNIIVFDLDRTLIDDDSRKLDGADELLEYCREKYDKIVLWSHGSSLHVDEQKEFSFKKFKFDVTLVNVLESDKSCKNLLHLYNLFPDIYFENAVLVDDSVFNYTPEYTKYIIPMIYESSKGFVSSKTPLSTINLKSLINLV